MNTLRGILDDAFRGATGRDLGDFLPPVLANQLPGGQTQETATVVQKPGGSGVGVLILIGAGLFLLWKGAK